MKLTSSILLLFFLSHLPGNAQPFGEKKYSFDMLTIDDGLSQGQTNWIIQDSLGFIWVATKDGLNRYDGSQFIIYRHDAENENTIAENYVNTLYEDSKHRLWIGTGSLGLDLFDRATETFIHFRHDEKNKQSISSNNVMEVSEDKDGNLYAITGKGINRIHVAENKKREYAISFSQVDSSVSGQVFSLKKGEVWISSESDSLYTLTKENNVLRKTVMPFPSSYFLRYPKQSRKVKAFAYDSTRQFIYMLMSEDMVRYDARKKAWKRLDGYTYKGTILGHGAVLDDAGQIWFCNGLHLYIYDTKLDQTSIVYSDDPRQMQMLSNATNVFKDKSDNIWIGTTGYGILKYNVRAEKFHHTGRESITGIVENNDKKVMILTQNYYANLFDKATGKFVGTMPDTTKTSLTFRGFLNGALQDNTGNYWLSYGYDKLYAYNEPAGKVINNFTPSPVYFPLFKDNNNGIWFGSSDSLFNYNIKTQKLSPYHIPEHPFYNYYDFIQVIRQQNDSIFWLGTTNGIYSFNRNSIKWKNYQVSNGDETSLSNNIVFTLCLDPKNPDAYLWVGTNGFGMDRLDITTGKFIKFTTREGLPNDVVYGIISDEENNLWVSTNKGLSRFNLSNETFLNYEEKDGLQSNEFNRYAFCKTTDGTLFFGGVNGFNYFKPRDLGKNTVPPNVVITNFKIGNKPVNFYNSKILSKPIELTDKIIVNYSDNMISFDFAAMDFTQPSKNLYQYTMEGFDKEWIFAGNARTATYTNLDPGTYTFRVKGSNSDGVWNENGTSIQLEILPPWYITWWFRTLLIITIAGAAYSFYRYRLQQALNLQAIRNKIASDLHDEIGSNLSSISIFSDVAQQETKGTPVAGMLSKISSYTHESMEAMSDIVWMINANNDRFENIINRMRELAAELFEAKKSTLHLLIDEQLNTLKLGMNGRKNFWLIYKEAVNNIAKYADAKNVWIQLSASRHEIFLTVKDDGKGFDTNEISNGNGLKNMQHRAELLKGKLTINSSPGKGVQVQLKFST